MELKIIYTFSEIVQKECLRYFIDNEIMLDLDSGFEGLASGHWLLPEELAIKFL